MANYRPISLVSSVSKVVEKAILSRLINFLGKHNLMCGAQHGFTQGRSTETAILAFLNKILRSIDNHEICVGIFCDLSKAFDCVNHEKLLTKMECMGIRGAALGLFRSYLTDRTSSVILREGLFTYSSDKATTSIGVPQGSILGPILFLVYINDLISFIKKDFNIDAVMYADDISFMIQSRDERDIQMKTKGVVDKMTDWFNSNGLFLNVGKTRYVHFRAPSNKNNLDIALQVNGAEILKSSYVKFLGIVLEERLVWAKHCSELCNKLRSSCYAIRNLKDSLRADSLKVVYYAYVYSRVKYGIIFWGSSQYAQDVFIMQKKIVRLIANVKQETSCKGPFKDLQILPLPCIYILECLLTTRKNLHLLDLNGAYHNYNTRHCGDIRTPPHNLTLYEQGPLYWGHKFYNGLPDRIRGIQNYNRFKSACKELLLEKCCYDFKDFLIS